MTTEPDNGCNVGVHGRGAELHRGLRDRRVARKNEPEGTR
jgi:hypothetical protein